MKKILWARAWTAGEACGSVWHDGVVVTDQARMKNNGPWHTLTTVLTIPHAVNKDSVGYFFTHAQKLLQDDSVSGLTGDGGTLAAVSSARAQRKPTPSHRRRDAAVSFAWRSLLQRARASHEYKVLPPRCISNSNSLCCSVEYKVQLLFFHKVCSNRAHFSTNKRAC